jgi:hypothetical protein
MKPAADEDPHIACGILGDDDYCGPDCPYAPPPPPPPPPPAPPRRTPWVTAEQVEAHLALFKEEIADELPAAIEALLQEDEAE